MEFSASAIKYAFKESRVGGWLVRHLGRRSVAPTVAVPRSDAIPPPIRPPIAPPISFVLTADGKAISHETIGGSEYFHYALGEREFYVVGGVHGSAGALDLTKRALSGVSDGEKDVWHLLVEGEPDLEDAEIKYAYTFARENGLAIERAVVSSADRLLTEELVSGGVGTLEEILLDGILRLTINEPLEHALEDILIRANGYSDIQEVRGLSERLLCWLADVVRDGRWDMADGIWRLNRANTLYYKFREIHAEALRVSNEMTRKRIAEILAKNPGKRKILIQMGRAHLGAVIDGYPAESGTNRFSPERLEPVIKRAFWDLLPFFKEIKPQLADEVDPGGILRKIQYDED